MLFHRKFDGSVQLVLNTVQLLRRIISQTKWSNARELMDIILLEGKILMETAPSETVVGNMIRRILKIIRDEYGSIKKGKQDEADVQESLQKILLAEGGELDYAKIIPNLKSAIMDSIGELITEIEIRYETFYAYVKTYLMYSNYILAKWTLLHKLRSIYIQMKRL